jgi:hypothetical protein
MTKLDPDGHIGKLYGVTLAIEHNNDGSVTICEEVKQEILDDKDTPQWIKDILTGNNAIIMSKDKHE